MQHRTNTQLHGLSSYKAGMSISELREQHGLTHIVKLASNENPFGTSERVAQILRESITDLNLYPEVFCQSLEERLYGEFPEFRESAVVVGNGMDNILECVSRMLLESGESVLIPVPTFSYYEQVSVWRSARIIFTEFDTQSILHQLRTNKIKLLFLCSPNNPTGQQIPDLQVIINTCLENNTYIFLDEAYIDFAPQSNCINIINYPNVIIGRTFSKIYGLAALRIGWAAMSRDLLDTYRKVQPPFVLSSLAIKAAIAALDDREFYDMSRREIIAGRAYLAEQFRQLGFDVLDSAANFLAIQTQRAPELFRELLQRGFILRHVGTNFRYSESDMLRCSVGTPEQNQQLIEVLRDILHVRK